VARIFLSKIRSFTTGYDLLKERKYNLPYKTQRFVPAQGLMFMDYSIQTHIHTMCIPLSVHVNCLFLNTQSTDSSIFYTVLEKTVRQCKPKAT